MQVARESGVGLPFFVTLAISRPFTVFTVMSAGRLVVSLAARRLAAALADQ